jgi:uncharacterized protein (DUF433 family)
LDLQRASEAEVPVVTLQGIIRGNLIVLEREPGLPDGQAVTVEIRPALEANSVSPPAPDPPPPWWLDHLDVNPAVRPGKFVVKGTRLEAEALVALLEADRSEEDLLRTYPELTPRDVAAVREYAKVPLEMRRLFGAWAEDAAELDQYLEWNRQQRKVRRREIED